MKNVTDAECREWTALGMEVAAQQNEGDPGCKCATCLVFVSLADIVKGRDASPTPTPAPSSGVTDREAVFRDGYAAGYQDGADLDGSYEVERALRESSLFTREAGR